MKMAEDFPAQPGSLRVRVNGVPREIAGVASVEDALRFLGTQGSHFAVALNRRFVPRSRYAEVTLNDGDELEILSPMQGG